ncbi:hypothetical protein LTR78_004579 [Recurvomyces mirabilis]|uniref:Uncharacterized protein n=1 Tax=Recurvomyces mirabilis TaxID=574656 RepID=A0AAE0WPG7_9PEZI|nr:hypothetical protein LTR78_004579 [Recurvomyces mirabilis]KAK5152927.1 hypothetical protein LTS14_008035 [Recurvomyces mirabilis]
MGTPPSSSTPTSPSASPGPTSFPQQQQHQQYGQPNIQPSPPRQSSFTFSAPPPVSIPVNAFAPSPIAPAYSPITPKVQPILPVPQPNGASTVIVPPADEQHELQPESQQQAEQQNIHTQSSAIAPATFIPPAAPQPFSSEDSTDAIALRAAISALQFQRKKAKDDLRCLEGLKKAAVDEPGRFREEVRAGRLREQREEFAGWRGVLDGEGSDDDNDEEDDEEDEEETLDADEMHDVKKEIASQETQLPSEILDSQPSRPSSSEKMKANPTARPPKPPDFTTIPGPQNIIRMPAMNWEKYHIVGSALDQMHEQQRKWPGFDFAYDGKHPANGGVGREYSVAAPYSPFLDVLAAGGHGQGGGGWDEDENRKDSVNSAAMLGTVSEHPMKTRRGSSKMHP